MINSLKVVLSLFAVMGLLAGCTSNTKKVDSSNEPVVQETSPPVEPTPAPVIEPPRNPFDDISGLTTVFYFDFDQSILKSEARAALTIYAKVLRETGASVRIEGHGDERGSREYNMALGERRANAVRDFLVLQGVSSSSVETVSYGEEQPLSLGSSESAWSKNRRAEIIVRR